VNVAIIGTGYVGLTSGVCLAFLGHDVWCLDTDEEKVASLQAGRLPIFEPHLEPLARLASSRLRFTSRYAGAIPEAEVVMICVGTPPGPDGAPDLSYLSAAAQQLAGHVSGRFMVIVNKSTVPIGSGNWVGALVREAAGAGGDFAVVSNPEFLREGNAVEDSLYPDRIVLGAEEPRALEVMRRLYRPVIDQSFAAPSFLPRPNAVVATPVVETDLASAELVKYAANSFLALKISYINEISRVAERVGADVAQVARGIGLDARIGSRFLNAGVGWGGSCFGKDTAALLATAAEYGLEMPIVSAARRVNDSQRGRVVEMLLEELKILKGRTITLLGASFKPETDDLRDAPSLDIAQRLISRGARVRVHDPVSIPRARREYPALGAVFNEDLTQALAGADAAVVVTEWPLYRELDWAAFAPAMRTPVVLDGRGCLDRARLEAAGCRLLVLGRTAAGMAAAAVGTRG